jgi:uncharacterized membrane protein
MSNALTPNTSMPRAKNVPTSRRRLIIAGILLGVGLGGLFDGIVLHQILQWHHMVSSTTPPNTVENLELNTLGDGIVHAAAWVVTVAGVFVLMASNGARHEPGGTRTLVGALLAGWGLFNVVEGVIDHHLLGLHHVRPGADQLLYDVAFLVWGGAMLIVGWWFVARATGATSAETEPANRSLDAERSR